jgi:GNAT superfamily N-acetyltransferase
MNGRILVLLHALALAAVVAAAGGAVGLMIWVGRRNPSSVLLLLFALWVVSPFMGLQLADMRSKGWSTGRQATLHGATLALALGSLAIYWYVALRPQTPQPAFVFLVVPLASWLLMAAAVPVAARISGTRARRGAAGTMVLEPSVGVVESELQARLIAINEGHAGPLRPYPFALSVRDKSGRLVAGLKALVYWNALRIDLLWVDAAHRGEGRGVSLIRRAEELARERACEVSFVSTFDFQAPDFYVKLGYTEIGELRGVPAGSRLRWFSKRL